MKAGIFKEKFIVILISISIFLLLLEISLRITGWISLKTQDNAGSYAANKDSYIVLCLGDSFTYGVGAPLGQDYPSQLENLLKTHAQGKTFKVINAGVCSYNTSQILEKFKEILRRNTKPDLVTFLGGGANYWNYWGYRRYLKDNTFISAVNDYLYRVRIYKLGKLLLININKRIKDGSLARALQNKTVNNPSQPAIVKEKSSAPDAQVFQGKTADHFRKNIKSNVGFNDTRYYVNLGDTCEKHKQYEEAIKWFKKGLEAYPLNSIFYGRIGEVYQRLMLQGEAIKWFKKGIEVDPGNADCYAGMGWFYESSSNFEEAIAWFKKGIEVNPGVVSLYLGMGTAYQKIRYYKEAVECFGKAIELDPSNSLCYGGMGWGYQGLGRHEEAVAWFKKGIEVDPDNVFCYQGIAEACREQGHDEEAIKYYQKSIELAPGNIDSYYGLCYVYIKQRRYEKAKEYFIRAIKLKPHDNTLFNIAGQIYHPRLRYKKFRELIDLLPKDNFFPGDYADMLKKIQAKGGENVDKIDKEIKKWIASDIGKIIKVCQENGIKVIVHDYPWDQTIHSLVSNIPASGSVAVVSNYEKFRELAAKGIDIQEYKAPDEHCNSKGYGVMAENIFDKIRQEHVFNLQ